MSGRMLVERLLALLVGTGLFLAGNGLAGSTLALDLTFRGVAPVAIGVVQGAYFLGFAFGTTRAHLVVRRVGHIRAFAALSGLLAATVAGYGIVDGLGGIIPLRALAGFAVAGLFVVIESWLGHASEQGARGRGLNAYMFTVYGAGAVGQLLLQVPDDGGRRYLLAAAGVGLSALPVALTSAEQPALAETTEPSVATVWRQAPLGLVGGFSAGALIASWFGLGPVYLAGTAHDVSEVAWFMSSLLLGGLLLQWPFGLVSDALDRRAVMPTTGVGVALVSAVLAAADLPGLSVALLGLLYGGLVYAVYPLALANVLDRVPREQVLAASSGLLLMYSAGAFCGPLVASALMQAAGPAGLPVFSGVIGALVAAVALRRLFLRPPPEQVPFAPMQNAAPSTFEPVHREVGPPTRSPTTWGEPGDEG